VIDLIDTALTAVLRERGVAAELARHFPDRDPAQVQAVADAVAPFLGGLVGALRFMLRATHDTRAGRAVAFANGQILGYVLDDRDLLSERELGPLGLLDDAYLVHRHAAELIAQYPWLEAHAMDYVVPAPSALDAVARLLPEGVAAALERTSRTLVGVAAALIGTQAGAVVASELASPIDPDRVPPPPRLRLDDPQSSI